MTRHKKSLFIETPASYFKAYFHQMGKVKYFVMYDAIVVLKNRM